MKNGFDEDNIKMDLKGKEHEGAVGILLTPNSTLL